MKKLIVFLIILFGLCVPIEAKLRENGATSVIEYFVFRDQATGVVDTGVVIANIDTYYVEEGALISAKTDLATHAAGDDAWDATPQGYHMGNGIYRIDWANAAFDGGIGKSVQLLAIDGDGGAFSEVMEIQLSAPVDAVLVNSATPITKAQIQEGQILFNTTIAAYTSNTSFTITSGPTNDTAIVGCTLIVVDQADSEQVAVGRISAYTTAANTITLESDPLAAFTFANGDFIYVLPGDRGIDTATLVAGVDVVSFNDTVTNLEFYMDKATTSAANMAEIVDDSLLANMLTKTDGDVSDFDFTTDSLEALSTGTSAAAIADAVWDELKSDHVIRNSFGWLIDQIEENTSW